jgi:DNA-binding MarR family transcriptional regulator
MDGRDAGDREDVATRTWNDLRRLVTEIRDPRREVRERLGLSFVKVKALRALQRFGPLTLRELTDRLGTDPPYTTLVVDALQSAGLVTRGPHPSDRRAKQVQLTETGHRTARQAEEVLGTPPPELLAVPEADLTTLHRIVAALLEQMER